ncbi:MFS transporter [Solibacillus daqui]|uniref:MFS transporter n=1 Tax=Solibacillus daqui TaxID=2912187 RepID=UPI0023666489|nr:MFS transporter [Solibacillus daqui]
MTSVTYSKHLYKNKPFLFLIASQIVSAIGNWLDLLAIMTLVAVKWNASPLAVSGVMLVFVGPMVLFGPISGVLSDRIERRFIMVLSDLVCLVLVLGVAFSTELWQVYVLLFLKSSFVALFIPAKNGKLKEIVEEDQIQTAMGISAMIDNGAKIIGPVLSGMVVATLGIQLAFYIDALTFALSALLLLGVPKYDRNVVAKETEQKRLMIFSNLLVEMKEGFTFLKGIPVILVSLIISTLLLLVLQIADTQFMVLLREIFKDPVTVAGYSMAASGGGMFIASAIFTKKQIHSTLNCMFFGAFGLGISLIAVAAMSHLSTTFLTIAYPMVFFLAGFSFGSAIIPLNILAQKSTPVDKTGRVFGIINSMTTLGTFIGMVLGGILSELFGVVMTFIVSGTSLVVVSLLTIIIKSLSKEGIEMSPKVSQQYKENRKHEILRAAETVFCQKGFEPTTMKDVVELSGMSRGGVYQYFSSTEEMLKSILAERDEQFEKKIHDFIESNQPVWETVESILDAYNKETFHKISAVTYEYFVTGWRSEGMERIPYLLTRFNRARENLIKLLEKGVETGEFDPIQPLHTIATFIINVTDGILLQTLLAGNKEADTEGQIEALKIYLKTVLQIN